MATFYNRGIDEGDSSFLRSTHVSLVAGDQAGGQDTNTQL